MRTTALVAAMVLLAACNSGKTYTANGEVDTARDTSRGLNVPNIDVGMTKDTVSVPTVTMQKDTVVVDKPVITGHKQVEVSRPTIDVKKKP
ncbi:MAG TPA: hypothetical protein VJ867_12150 [Gemmatimonadaceae bacterium]|nr:hypothetical protein [Gemmatimonadaceae bacterium]